ncbi:MAG: PAS domain-containing protein, partial [Spirochaetota bacterium]
GNALYFHGHTGKYFEPAPGPARTNVVEMARKGLSIGLSSALSRAVADRKPQTFSGVTVETNEREETIDIHVRHASLEFSDEPCFLVTLTESQKPEPAPQANEGGDPAETNERLRELEEELQANRQNMRALAEEYEATNEELKSSNEELQSTNEELKSTNEELETSKEELQSINEEQSTLNAELQAKNEELVRVRDDMNNLLAGTRIATLFLDDTLCIRRFTPAMEEIMGLRETDQGRPVGDISLRVEYEELENDVEKVLSDLNSLEREIRAKDNRWFQLRIVPYRTADNIIDGVVATFNEITEIKRSEEQAKHAKALAESTVNAIEAPLIVLDANLLVETTNKAFLETFKLSRAEVTGVALYDINNGEWDIPELHTLIDTIAARETESAGRSIVVEFSRLGSLRLQFDARVVPIPDEDERRILLSIAPIENASQQQPS